MDGSLANTSIGSDSRSNVAKVGNGSVGDITDAGTGNCLANKHSVFSWTKTTVVKFVFIISFEKVIVWFRVQFGKT